MEVEAHLSENSKDSPNEDSFQQLFQQHYSLVVRKVLVIVKEQTIAEDIAQEVFVKLYKADWKTVGNIQGWLAKVAVHTAYNHIRTEKRHHARNEKQQRFEKDADRSIEDRFLMLEDISEVQKTLLKLSDRDRDILIMKFSGYSYEEIAENKGIEKLSIGALLARAKKRFKQSYLEGRGENP